MLCKSARVARPLVMTILALLLATMLLPGASPGCAIRLAPGIPHACDQSAPADSPDRRRTQQHDTVTELLSGLTAAFPELKLGAVRRTDRMVTAMYEPSSAPPPPDGRPPWTVVVTVESFETDAETDAGLEWSMMRPMGPTRRDSLGAWWDDRAVLARAGRHIVEVRANRADAEPLVPRVMAHLAPMVTALRRTRPQRPFRAGNFDAVTLLGAPRALRDSVGEEYHRGAALTGFAYDLNCDGTDDYLVKGTMCGTGGCPYRIVDSASLRGVGLVFGYPLIVRAQSTGGWPDIDVYSHLSATSGSYTSLEFDGANYSARETRQLAGDAVVNLFASFESIPWFRPGR